MAAPQPGSDNTAVRPFTFDVPDAKLDELRSRITATEWPEQETVADQSQGVPLATMQALGRYWANEHDWRKCYFFYKNGLGYTNEMAHRPQTLYGIADSPIGLAAWMLDHDAASLALIVRVFDGRPEGLTRDDILDNVTLYWLTKTAVSSARLYWESKLAFFAPKGVAIPTAVSVFPDEIYAAPKSWTEKAYPNLIHYNRLPKGSHFAAYEQPEFFTAEMRAAFGSLRQ